ncbi:MAG TPA: phenylalanine--tRNA ligase subunit beta [Candidatus Pacearchaeota archaeon]|nr:phenylalanine--tRNA ligase subunit beta [Candidatus Pacearchaeota archaeon]
MVFSYNWLQKFFSQKLPSPHKLAELLALHVFETEKIEKKGKDWAIDVDILPNRIDCMSHMGLAREIGAILGLKLKVALPKIKEDRKERISKIVKVNVSDQNDCLRYTAKYVFGIKVGHSPKWLAEALGVCGLNSINNVVDAANYVMLELGQPLHCFDYDKIAAGAENKEIIVRRAGKNEKIFCLDGKDYTLDESILVIADLSKALAIAGIKGGKAAEIDRNTTKLVLESANFDQHLIRAASKKLNLKTDASWRYEHGLDPNLTELAVQRFVEIIQQISDGKCAQGAFDFYPRKNLPKRVKISLSKLGKILGQDATCIQVNKVFKLLGFRIVNIENENFIVDIPTFRSDISIPEDLAEEFARLYGYEKIEPKFPKATLVPSQKNDSIFWGNYLRGYFQGLGFYEQINYNFIGEREKDIFGFKQENLVELENPLSTEFKYLRPCLIAGLVKNIKENAALSSEMKFVEIGHIFEKKVAGEFIDAAASEKPALSIVIARKKDEEIFLEAKGIAESMLAGMALPEVAYIEQKGSGIWAEYPFVHIELDGEKIGHIGEINKDVLDALKIQQEVAAFEIDFNKLARLATEESYYEEFSKFPSVVRDISLLVPSQTRVGDVLDTINSVGGDLIKDVDLFDIFENGDEQDKKSLAFHIIYQAQDRTLTSSEIDMQQLAIISALERNKNWVVKKDNNQKK